MLSQEELDKAEGVTPLPAPMRSWDTYEALPERHPLKRDDHPIVRRVREMIEDADE